MLNYNDFFLAKWIYLIDMFVFFTIQVCLHVLVFLNFHLCLSVFVNLGCNLWTPWTRNFFFFYRYIFTTSRSSFSVKTTGLNKTIFCLHMIELFWSLSKRPMLYRGHSQGDFNLNIFIKLEILFFCLLYSILIISLIYVLSRWYKKAFLFLTYFHCGRGDLLSFILFNMSDRILYQALSWGHSSWWNSLPTGS